VLPINVVRQNCKKVALGKVPEATYDTAVFCGRKTGFGNVELVAMAPAPPVVAAPAVDLPVVQATFQMAAPPEAVSPPAVAQPEVVAANCRSARAAGGPGMVHARLCCRVRSALKSGAWSPIRRTRTNNSQGQR